MNEKNKKWFLKNVISIDISNIAILVIILEFIILFIIDFIINKNQMFYLIWTAGFLCCLFYFKLFDYIKKKVMKNE